MWSLILSAYDYAILYRSGEEHANSDSLSHLPLPEPPSTTPQPADTILLMETLQTSPVTAQQIRQWKDRLLSRIRNLVLQGCRDGEEEEMRPFNRRSEELSVQDGCVLWGSRVIIPKKGQQGARVLELLHDGHPGISRMKGIVRSIVWWPVLTNEIEEMVWNCSQCQQHQKAPPQSPLHPWEWPDQPWLHLHIDHAGPFLGKQFLILVDAHSKWMEVEVVPSTATSYTIAKLRRIFAKHGLPETIVSDNGTRVQGVYKAEWYSTSNICTIPPCYEWTSGESSSNFQNGHEETHDNQ